MIKTWQQRCEEHPDHDGIVTNQMIQARMQEEIDDLRAAIDPRKWKGLTDEEIAEVRHLYDGTAGWTIERFARQIEAKIREKNNG